MQGYLDLPSLLFLVWFCNAVQGQKCYQSQADFANECSNVYGGIVDGGRCFFLGRQGQNYSIATWNEAWALCASQGATMAQIHTSHEFSAIEAYFKSSFGTGQYVRIALARDPTLTNTDTGRSMDTQKTRWYDDSSNYNPLLTVANTWVRAHQLDDAFTIDHNCYHFYGNFKSIGDCPCDVGYMPLCTIYNSVQNFNLVPSAENGNCMAETAIQAFAAVSSTVDCAVHCTDYIWCRGYNYFLAAQKCELFSWYYNDTTKFAMNSDCYHYAYVP